MCLLVSGAALAGCGQDQPDRPPVHPVEGQVTLNGQPLAGAYVVLHPKNNADPRVIAARGQTDSSGKFRATTFNANDGAVAGEYAVTVQYYQPIDNGGSSEPGPNVLPPRLALPDSTDIRVRVTEGPNTLVPIEVRR